MEKSKLMPAQLPPGFSFDTSKPIQATGLPEGFSLDQESPGLFNRIGNDWNKRVNQLAQGMDAQNTGGQTGFETGLQTLGTAGNLAFNDIPSEAVSSAIHYTPDIIKKPIGDFLSNAVSSIANIVPPGGDQTIGNVAQGVGQEYSKFEQDNPRAARDISAALGVGNAALAFAPVHGQSAVGAAVDATKTTGQALGNVSAPVLKYADQALGKTIRPTAEDLKSAASQGYKTLSESGGMLPGEAINNYINTIQKILPQSAKEEAAFGINPAQKLAKNMDAYRNSDLSLNDAMTIDQRLGDFIHGPGTSEIGKLNPDGYAALQMQKQLRSVIGEYPGGDTYKQAVKDWSAQAQTSDIQRIIDRANMSDNSATVLKNGFKAISTNPGRLSQYPKDVQIAIKSAGEGAPISDFLRTQLGSRLISSIGGVSSGGIPGMVAAGALSSASRDGAEALQMGKANKVLDAIAANSSLSTTKIPVSEQIRQLMKIPVSQAKQLLESYTK